MAEQGQPTTETRQGQPTTETTPADDVRVEPQQTVAETAPAQRLHMGKQEAGAVRRELATEAAEERIAPLSAFRRFMDDMDRLFSGFGFGGGSLLGGTSASDLLAGGWSPPIETLERGDRIVFLVDLPGLTKDDVLVEMVDDELVIAGERKQQRQETKRGRFYSERRYGSFERRLVLPDGVDPESIQASFDNGVLEVSVKAPNVTAGRARKIEIKSAAPDKTLEESERGPESIH